LKSCIFVPVFYDLKINKSVLKKFRNILAFVLAQLVLFSTTSFAVDIHKCSGKIYDISVTGQAKSCELSLMHCYVKQHSGHSVRSKYCCSEVHFLVNANTIKREKNLQINSNKFNNPAVLNNISITKVKPIVLNKTAYKNYTPPIVTDNILVSYQVFLI